MKVCCRCKLEKTEDSFYPVRKGQPELYGHCKECERLYQRLRYQALRAKEREEPS